ncbi:hypothetical protein EVA_21123, partial [gut metagenome]
AVKVVEDGNWDIFNDTHVTVSVEKNSGPTQFEVTVYYQD